MSAALILPVAGSYSGTITPPNVSAISSPYYNLGASSGPVGAQGIGILDDKGYEISMTLHEEMVNRTDGYAQTLLETINQGQDWRILITGREWDVGLMLLFQPYGAVPVSGVKFGILSPRLGTSTGQPPAGDIGTKGSLSAGILTLTSDLGSPPTAPATLLANLVKLAPESQASFNLTSKVRDLPLQLCLLPYEYIDTNSVHQVVPFTVA